MMTGNPVTLMQDTLGAAGYHVEKVAGQYPGETGVYIAYGGIEAESNNSYLSAAFYYSIEGRDDPEATFADYMREAWEVVYRTDYAIPRAIERFVEDGEAEDGYIRAGILIELVNE